MIHPVADKLGVSRARVFANDLLFDREGAFVDFDRSLHTSRDGGKAAVVGDIKRSNGYRTVVMIGDGATDLQVSVCSVYWLACSTVTESKPPPPPCCCTSLGSTPRGYVHRLRREPGAGEGEERV